MMEPVRWEQIERLYHAALEREPDARDAFLDEARAGDEELRREVAGLLACDLPSDSFIQSPAIEIVARAMAAALIQSRLQGLVDRQTAVEVLSGFRVRPRLQEVSAKLGSSAMARSQSAMARARSPRTRQTSERLK